MIMAVDIDKPEVDLDPPPENDDNASDLRPVFFTMALTGILGAISLGARSIGQDESISAGLGLGSWDAFRVGVGEDGGSQSLYFLLVRLASVLGPDPWIMRLPALIAAMLVPYPLYRLVEPRFGRSTAFRAMILLAVSYTFVANSQEGRAYTLLAAILTWTWFALDQALERGTLTRWLTVGFLAALSLYAQPLGVPVLMAMAVWVLMHRQQVVGRYFVAAGALAAVLAAPFAYLAMFEAVDHTEWLGTFTVGRFAEMVAAMLGAQDIKASLALSVAGVGFVACFALFETVSVGDPKDRNDRRDYRESTGLFLLWAALPLAVLVAGSFSRAYFSARYAVPLMPPVMVLAAAGTSRLGRLDRRLSIAAFAGLVAILGVRTATGYGNEDVPWDELQAYVAERATPRDIVAFEPAYAQSPFEYYTYLNGDVDTMARPMAPALGWTAPRHPNIEEYPDTTLPAPEGDLWIVVWGGHALDEAMPLLDRFDVDMVEVERQEFGVGLVVRYQHLD